MHAYGELLFLLHLTGEVYLKICYKVSKPVLAFCRQLRFQLIYKRNYAVYSDVRSFKILLDLVCARINPQSHIPPRLLAQQHNEQLQKLINVQKGYVDRSCLPLLRLV